MRTLLVPALLTLTVGTAAAQQGDVGRGQRLFQNCTACHSLEPDKNLTGPSLSGVIGRKAGTLQSFSRYSDPIKFSGVVWDAKTLDSWLADPQHVIPGNQMTFPGIENPQQRADVIAFLKQASERNSRTAQQMPSGGGMGGMMSNAVPNLKNANNASRVQTVRYCRDTYEVTTADGNKRQFFERNLRFKTDSSDDGPTKGAPALVSAGMMGDRADVIFSAPDEIGAFLSKSC
ncbi:MAG: cytochrome c [Methylobacteriaceae bacterium]|jgi:cytochrome c|nr:cytochrome c [Methylobacteriaceae bacterium]